MDVVEAKKEQLLDTSFAKEFYVDMLKAAEERNMVNISTEENGKTVNITPAQIVAFDDEFEQEELVTPLKLATYASASPFAFVDPSQRQIGRLILRSL
jgi:hypothetical protein